MKINKIYRLRKMYLKRLILEVLKHQDMTLNNTKSVIIRSLDDDIGRSYYASTVQIPMENIKIN